MEIEKVDHPAHYAESCSMECIDVMEMVFGAEAILNFCLCNSFKYLWRYKHKNGEEDAQKAQWYLDKFYNTFRVTHPSEELPVVYHDLVGQISKAFYHYSSRQRLSKKNDESV